MKQKIFMLLALLMAAVSGAWADELATEYTTTPSSPLNNVTVSADMEVNIAAGVTVTINNGLNIASGKTLIVKGPGTLVVNGTNGASGNDGSDGEDGGASISGNIAVYGATVQATGGNGGNGGNSNENPGGIGGNTGAAFSGAVSIYSGKIIAQGGIRGNGGDGTDGPGQIGESSAAFSGTLTFFGGTVEATSGDDFTDAFDNDVIMKASTYELVGGDDAGSATAIDVNSITNSQYVKITAPDAYTLSVANSEHGTVKFYMDGNLKDELFGACEGNTVYMTVTPETGWMVDASKVIAELSTNWESAGTRSTLPIQKTVTLNHERTNTDTGARTYYFTMPAASVKASAGYIPIAAFATEGTEPDVKTLTPTAAEGVYVGEQKAIVVAGTVAKIGATENAQGTVKYLATTDATMTAAQALEANGWVTTLPTAEAYTNDYADDLKVYVWYYIAAADGYANSAPARLEVTLLKNLYTLNFSPKEKTGLITVTVKTGDADATPATPDTDGKISPVKMGSTVTLTPQTGYKFRKVEVKKDANNIVDVVTNAAQAGATFTEATFTMPAYDATVEYELVRDMEYMVSVQIAARVSIELKNNVYQAVDPSDLMPALMDNIGSEGKPLVMGGGADSGKDFYIKGMQKFNGDDWEDVTDLGVGTYRQVLAGIGNYDGIIYTDAIQLYEQKELTFSKGYSTHYYSESLMLDEVKDGLKFYAVTAVTSEKVTLTEIEAKAIPAGTPFIAYNSTAEPITALMGILEADDVTSAEQFKGTAEDKPMAAQSGCYVLRNGDSTPTFRLVEGAGTLPAHRCWIDLGSAASSRTLSICFDDDTTGIDSIDNGQWTIDNYYNLLGRKRQGTPQRKGVYVKDGRKVIVK